MPNGKARRSMGQHEDFIEVYEKRDFHQFSTFDHGLTCVGK